MDPPSSPSPSQSFSRLSFRTEEDIVRVVSALSSSGVTESTLTEVQHVSDPKRIIQLGLRPSVVQMGPPWSVYWMQGVDHTTIEFWTRTPVSQIETLLRGESTWIYKSLEQRRKEAIATGSSFSLLLYLPELVRPLRGRETTDGHASVP